MNVLKWIRRRVRSAARGQSAALILLASVSASAQEKGDAGAQRSGESTRKTITLNIKKGDIGDALRLVAEQGGLNLVIGPDVKGEVSVYLTEATLDTALKAIAINNGFAYRLYDGVITVSRAAEKSGPEPPPPLVTRIFNLRSQDAERVKDALEFALSKYGKMKVLNQNSQGGYGVQRLSSLGGDLNGTGGSSGLGSSGGSGNGASSTPGGGMGAGPSATGSAQATTDHAHNARTLVVTDTLEAVERIGQLVADLDRLPPQVLIEARIVEMTTDLQRQLGIDWNIDAIANGPVLNHGWPLENKAGFASGSQIMRRFDGSPYQTAGLALGTVDFSQLTALVRANQTDTSIRLLANPRLLVYNNHSASILVGERYPILQANISNFGTATESLQTYIPVGVQLEVTPTIMMDGAISMLVHPATSALGDDVVGTTGLRVARIRTRELDTRVIMHDGQTIVLGGLISDRKLHQAKKVPGLGDVPVLDVLFRQENPHSERVDLLIFLTAHVESATQISERDQQVFEMYKPHFKLIERLQDVPLHFEIPTEYEPPKPMFSDPPIRHSEEGSQESEERVEITPTQDSTTESSEADETVQATENTQSPESKEATQETVGTKLSVSSGSSELSPAATAAPALPTAPTIEMPTTSAPAVSGELGDASIPARPAETFVPPDPAMAALLTLTAAPMPMTAGDFTTVVTTCIDITELSVVSASSAASNAAKTETTQAAWVDDRPEVETVPGMSDDDPVAMDNLASLDNGAKGEPTEDGLRPGWTLKSVAVSWFESKWAAVLSAIRAAQQASTEDQIRASLQAWQGSTGYDQP